jgi:prepilin-type N-terminal cleavage/methylation domain-containing protein
MRLSIKKGFTLIELMIVIALITIMASVFLLGRNQYSDRLNLKTQSYALASLIRQAQAYSLGVRANNGNFNSSYGISVTKSAPATVVFFVDTNKNGKYDSSNSESIDSYDMADGTQIVDICGLTSGAENCSNLDRVDVTFARPSPVAVIKFLNSGGSDVLGRNPPGKIYLQSASGSRVSITLDITGQVSIQ